MLAFPAKQEHPESNVLASLPGVPSHPSQLAQYKTQGLQMNGSVPETNRTLNLVNTSYQQGKQRNPNTNMDESSQPYNMMDESQVDIASAKGIFGWAVVDRTNVPYIIREKKRYVSVRMVEMKLLSKYPSTYPDELKDKPPLMSQYITPAEAKLLNEINFEHCAGEFGNSEFNAKDLIVSLEDFEEFYNIVRKHFPDEVLESYAKGNHRTSADGGWVQVNNTVVPYVLRNGVKLVPLSVIRYAAGLLGSVKVHGIEPAEEECVYLNKSCESAGLDFKFAKSTKMIELKLIPNLSKTKVNIVELPKYDPFGSAEYQDLPEEEEKSVQMGATLPVNMPVMPQSGMQYMSAPPVIGMTPGARMPLHQPRGMVVQRMPYEAQMTTGQPPPGSGWMNPHIGVYPGYPGISPGTQMVTGQTHPYRPMGPPAFTATQSSPAGTILPGYISPEGGMQPNQPNHHALQNLQHMTKMAEMQMGRNKRRKSNDGRSTLMSNSSASPNQNSPPYVLDSYRNQQRNSAHISPPQHHGLQSQLSPRIPLSHMPPHPMMEGVPSMNGVPPPGMMMHGMGPPPQNRPSHPQMQRMSGLQHVWQQQMPRNQAEYQEMMRQISPDMTKSTSANSKRGSLMRSQAPAVNIARLEGEKMPNLSGLGSSHNTPNSRSPVISLHKDALTNNQPRERGRIKSTPTRRSPSISVPTVSPPPQPIIKTVEFHNKTISCIIKNGEYYALVEAISRVYFPYCSLQDFQFALEKVLQVRITQLDREEEEIYIKFYGLPTKSLKCTKCVHLKDFDEYMPQLKYMFKDKEQDSRAKQKESSYDELVAQLAPSPNPIKSAGDTNNNAKYCGEEKKSAGARSETFNVLKSFLGKRSSDGVPGNPTASKVAKGFASRLEDAVNRLKKKNNLQEDAGTSTQSSSYSQKLSKMPQASSSPEESMECPATPTEALCEPPETEELPVIENLQGSAQKHLMQIQASSLETFNEPFQQENSKEGLCDHIVISTPEATNEPNANIIDDSTKPTSKSICEASSECKERSVLNATVDPVAFNLFSASNELKSRSLETPGDPIAVSLPEAYDTKITENALTDTNPYPVESSDSTLDFTTGSLMEKTNKLSKEALVTSADDEPIAESMLVLASEQNGESLTAGTKELSADLVCELSIQPSVDCLHEKLPKHSVSLDETTSAPTKESIDESCKDSSVVILPEELMDDTSTSFPLDNSSKPTTVGLSEASCETATGNLPVSSRESMQDSLILVHNAATAEMSPMVLSEPIVAVSLPGVVSEHPAASLPVEFSVQIAVNVPTDDTIENSETRPTVLPVKETAQTPCNKSTEPIAESLLHESSEPPTEIGSKVTSEPPIAFGLAEEVGERPNLFLPTEHEESSAASLPLDKHSEPTVGGLPEATDKATTESMPEESMEPMAESLHPTEILPHASNSSSVTPMTIDLPEEFGVPTAENLPEATKEPLAASEIITCSKIEAERLLEPAGEAMAGSSPGIVLAHDITISIPTVTNESAAIYPSLSLTTGNSSKGNNLESESSTEKEETNGHPVKNTHEATTDENKLIIEGCKHEEEGNVLEASNKPASGSHSGLPIECVEECMPESSCDPMKNDLCESNVGHIANMTQEDFCCPALANESNELSKLHTIDTAHSEKEEIEVDYSDSQQDSKDVPVSVSQSNVNKITEYPNDVSVITSDNYDNSEHDAEPSVDSKAEDETKTEIVKDGKDGSVAICFD